jgi:hypothetical protein
MFPVAAEMQVRSQRDERARFRRTSEVL